MLHPDNGGYRQFRIRTKGVAGESWYSDFVESTSIKTNSTPPTFTASVQPEKISAYPNASGNVFIKGITKLRATITNASAAAPKSVAGYYIGTQQYGSITGDTLISSVLTAAGKVTISYEVKDSEGYSQTQTKEITVQDYYEPGVSIVFGRCKNEQMEADPLGEYIMYKATTTLTNVDNNIIQSVQLTANQITYNLIADGEWHVVSGYTQPANVRRDVSVTVSDLFTSSTIQTMIFSANYAIYLNDNGTAIGFGTTTDYSDSVEIARNRTLYVANITIIPTTPTGTSYS